MNILNKIKQNLTTIILISIIILLFKPFINYFKNRIIISLGGYTTQTINTIIDSTFIKGKIDTIAVFNKYVSTKGINLNPKAKIIYIKNPLNKGKEIDSLKEFTVSIKDTLIEGKFTILNYFNGNLKSSTFKYKPLFPKYITRVDTLKIETNSKISLTNKRTLLGLGVGYSNLQYFSILGSYTTKNKWQFIYEYGKPLTNTINIINGETFKTSTTDLHSIKIIKHF